MGGYDLQWADWDGNIYIHDPFVEEFPNTTVFMFDTAEQQLSTTSHKGIYFSPDGGRYFSQGYEGSPLRVFDADADEEIAADLLIQAPTRTRAIRISNAAGWSDEDTLIIPSPIPQDEGDYLYGVTARSLWQAEGPIVPVRLFNDRVLVLSGTTVVEAAKEGLRLVQ